MPTSSRTCQQEIPVIHRQCQSATSRTGHPCAPYPSAINPLAAIPVCSRAARRQDPPADKTHLQARPTSRHYQSMAIPANRTPRWHTARQQGVGEKRYRCYLFLPIYILYIGFFSLTPFPQPPIYAYIVLVYLWKNAETPVTPETHLHFLLPTLPVFPLLFPYHLVFQAFSDRICQFLYSMGIVPSPQNACR